MKPLHIVYLLMLIVLCFFRIEHARASGYAYIPDFPKNSLGLDVGQRVFSYGNDLYTQTSGEPHQIFPDINNPVYQRSGSIKFPLESGPIRLPVTLNQAIKTASLGVAAVAFMKKAIPYVGTAIAVYDIVCALTSICRDPVTGVVQTSSTTYLWSGYGNGSPPNGAPTYATPQSSCEATLAVYHQTGITSKPSTTNPKAYDCFSAQGGTQAQAAAYQVNNSGTTTKSPTTDDDYNKMLTIMADNRLAQPLLDAGEPLPIVSSIPAPNTTTITGPSTTVRDINGTATGTSVTHTDITPSANPLDPTGNTINATSVTTTTVTDITNNTTNTTTTTSTPPENPDPVVDIDNVPDPGDLPTKDIGTQYQSNSWGEGTCPPDINISTSHGSLIIPFRRTCDFASMSRPVVIAIAGFVAACIIAGVKLD